MCLASGLSSCWAEFNSSCVAIISSAASLALSNAASNVLRSAGFTGASAASVACLVSAVNCSVLRLPPDGIDDLSLVRFPAFFEDPQSNLSCYRRGAIQLPQQIACRLLER